jgi:hypothetical protein
VDGVDTINMRMCKLYENDYILFTDGTEVFGHKVYSENEIKTMSEDQSNKTNDKPTMSVSNGVDGVVTLSIIKSGNKKLQQTFIEYFNSQSYKKLQQKIVDYCWAKSEENPDMKTVAYDCIDHFENGRKGLVYEKIDNEDGYFEGWMNKTKKMNSLGLCRFKSGIEYIGEWSDGEFSGQGTLSRKDESGNVISRYTGNFSKYKFNGKGLYQDALFVYDGEFKDNLFDGQGKLILNNNSYYSGTWAKGLFKEGDGAFDDGIYTGKWKYIKIEGKKTPTTSHETTEKEERVMISTILMLSNQKENKKMPVPHGEGTWVKANGETITGEWKNGKYINKNKK